MRKSTALLFYIHECHLYIIIIFTIENIKNAILTVVINLWVLITLLILLIHLSFFITNLSNLVLYITSKNFSLVYSTKDSPLFLFIICIFFNYIFILLLLFFFKNHSEISIFYSIFFHLLCKTCFFRNFMLYYYSTFL